MKALRLVLLVALMHGIGPIILRADLSTNLAPGVPLGTNDLNSVRAAGSNSLSAFKSHITPSNYQLMGFSSVSEVALATNGNPLLIFTVSMSQLTNYQAGSDFNVLLDPPPPPRAIIPVMVGTNVRSSTTLRLAQGATGAQRSWAADDWGHPRVIRNLTRTFEAIPSSELKPGTVPFVVEILIPRIWFVGYYDLQNKLVLRATTDLRVGLITVPRNGDVVPAVMQELSINAQHYDPNLPN